MQSPNLLDYNVNVGFIVGYANWPEAPGEHTIVVTAGLSSGRVVGALVPWRRPFEFDFTISNSGDAIAFFGFGGGNEDYPSSYIGVGATVYLGGNIFDIPRVAYEKMVDVSRWLFDVEDMNDFQLQ